MGSGWRVGLGLVTWYGVWLGSLDGCDHCRVVSAVRSSGGFQICWRDWFWVVVVVWGGCLGSALGQSRPVVKPVSLGWTPQKWSDSISIWFHDI